MLDTPTIEWLRKQKAAGYSDQQLIQYLLREGHTQEEINEGLRKAGEATQPIRATTNQVQTTTQASQTRTVITQQKRPTGLYILIGILLIIAIGSIALILKMGGQMGDIRDAYEQEKTKNQQMKEEMQSQIDTLQEQISQIKTQNEETIAEKDAKISELENNNTAMQAEINRLNNELKQYIEQRMTGKKSSEENTSEQNNTETTGNTSGTQEQTQTTEGETTMTGNEEGTKGPLHTNDTTTLYFPYENIEWDLKDDLNLTAWAYNKEYEDKVMGGKIYCLNLNDEEFDLAEAECRWVKSRTETKMEFFASSFLYEDYGERNCYLEIYYMDEGCTEKTGGLSQIPFVLDAY